MINNYRKHENGVIEQIIKEPFNYDFDYSNNYNKLGEIGTRMAYLRLGHLIGSLGFIPNSVMDVGYGNGDFLKACQNIIPKCYASDISEYPSPDGCEFVKDPNSIKVDVATFYDVLEHYMDIYDIKNIEIEGYSMGGVLSQVFIYILLSNTFKYFSNSFPIYSRIFIF